jgi:predicted Holliday junction resolvase-like endonuclease
MSQPNDPLEPIKKLAERLKEEAEKIGLDMLAFGVVPNMDGGPHTVQCMFGISADKVVEAGEQDEETARVNAEFNAILEGDKKSEAEQKLEDARQNALRLAQELQAGRLHRDESEGD